MATGVDSHRVATMVRRIGRQIRRDRRTMGLMIVAPIVVSFLFALMFAGSISNVPMAVCIQDEPLKTTLGQTITDILEANENTTVMQRSQDQAFEGFGTSVQAVLVLPPDLTQGLVTGADISTHLYVNVTTQIQASFILAVVANSTKDAASQMFGSKGINIATDIIYLIPTPAFGGSLSFNLSLVNEDEGFPKSIGSIMSETLSQNGNISVLTCDSRDTVVESIRNETAVAGVYISPDFTGSILSGGTPTVEMFTNGIESTEASVVLAAVQDALTESLKTAIGRETKVNVTYVYGEAGMSMIELAGPSMIGFLGLFFSFIISGIFFLRERQQGTLERMHASPLSDLEIISGYVLAFIAVSLVQTTLVSCVILFFSPTLASSILLMTPLVVLLVIGSVTLAIAVSYRMKNELQVMQMIPVFIIPQIFLCGIFFPLALLPDYLAFLPYIFPLTYFVMAVKAVVFFNATLLDVALPLLVLLLYCFLGVGLAVARRSE